MRLLSLICLARCAAALPDIGVTYAATGRLNVLDPISRAAGSIIGLQSVAHLELSVLAAPLRQQAGVLLVGVASS